MLVLTRRENQKIHIGDDISVLVVKARDGSVRLGIDAPSDVWIGREEIYERKHDRTTSRMPGVHFTDRDIWADDENE